MLRFLNYMAYKVALYTHTHTPPSHTPYPKKKGMHKYGVITLSNVPINIKHFLSFLWPFSTM